MVQIKILFGRLLCKGLKLKEVNLETIFELGINIFQVVEKGYNILHHSVCLVVRVDFKIKELFVGAEN